MKTIAILAAALALTAIVGDLQRAVAQKVKLPPGISVAYTGQF